MDGIVYAYPSGNFCKYRQYSFYFVRIGKARKKPAEKGHLYWPGLVMAVILRVSLLIALTVLLSLKKPFLMIDTDWVSGSLSVQGVLLLVGGLFLSYKSTKVIREKIEHRRHDEREVKRERGTTLSKVLVQVLFINLVFSLDSVLAAVGMTNGITADDNDALVIMILAALISLPIMISFANKINPLVENALLLKFWDLFSYTHRLCTYGRRCTCIAFCIV